MCTFLLFCGFAFIHMKIVAFVSGKGGVGKTTLGFLLGLVLQRAQRRVNYLDLDPQASLSSLLELHSVKRDESAATEFLIVDTPPRLESKEVRETVQRADVICIPMRPSPMDFGVTTNTAELVKTLKRPDSKAFIVLNQLRKGTYWSKKVETLNGSDFVLSFSNSSFSLRECFAHALTVGWEALDESASNELLNFALTIG
jgi:chromosome partitioning protein